jgi:putative FmdB family regulatory protein
MPIYEYACESCRKRFDILTLRVSEDPKAECTHCGSKKVRRLMSRFAMVRSEESRLEAMADPSKFAGLDENDPKSVARWMKKMGRELGEDVAGEEMDEMAEKMESGELDEEGEGSGSLEDDLDDSSD